VAARRATITRLRDPYNILPKRHSFTLSKRPEALWWEAGNEQFVRLCASSIRYSGGWRRPSACDVQDGVRALRVLVQDLDGFSGRQHQQFDLPTLSFEQHLFHHRQ